ncbi:MAG: glycosyltransferase family 39 protein [Acidobacteriota bacterium]|jgi:4-amino-4-deoxy-L-arabinose transferase-like glycosyltransferase
MKLKTALPVLIALLHLAILIVPARQHPFGNYATETDFYHLFAPDAQRILLGQMPENTYQGPGYPVVLALGAKLCGADLFAFGKWLSVVCAPLVGLLIFLLFRRLCGAWVGLGAQLLFIVSGEFPQFSINATTDVFFLLLCLTTLVILLSRRSEILERVILSGIFAGFAYLTRYNGLFLVATCLAGILLLNLFETDWRRRAWLAAIFVVVFTLTVSPWLYLNARRYGSPLYNTNYLNMATQFYPELVAGKTNQDGTRLLEEKFKSFGDVLLYNPGQALRRYPLTLWQSLRYSVTEKLVNRYLAILGLAGLLLALWRRRTREVQLVLLAGLLYLLLMGLNHWETRYYLFWGVILAGFAAEALRALGDLLRQHGGLAARGWPVLPIALFLLLWGLSVDESRADVRKFLDAQPWEVAAARDYLIGAYGGQTAGLRIVARKPHLPYLVNAEWIFFPQVRTIDDFKSWVEQNHVDFIVIGKRELKERKELAPLGKPSRAPEWLKPVWIHDETGLILYRVGTF